VLLSCGGVRLALHRAQLFFARPLLCCSFCLRGSGCTAVRSVDRCAAKASSQACNQQQLLRTASVGRAGGLGIRDTIQVFDVAETVAALHSGHDRLGGDASRFILQLQLLVPGLQPFWLHFFASASQASVGFARALHAHTSRVTAL